MPTVNSHFSSLGSSFVPFFLLGSKPLAARFFFASSFNCFRNGTISDVEALVTGPL